MGYDSQPPSIGGRDNLDPHEVERLDELRSILRGINHAIGEYQSTYSTPDLFKGQEEYIATLITYRKRVKDEIVELELLGFCLGVE